MDDHRSSFKIPLRLLLLDLVGTLLFAAGVATYFGGFELLPAAYRWEGYGLQLMIVGAVLCLPLIGFFIRWARQNRTTDPNNHGH